MIIFYDYYKDAEDLDSRDLYDYQLSTVNEICNGNPHNDYSNIRHIIVKDAEYAYWYARMYIKGRWPEAESAILQYPYFAYLYAHHVLKRRWLEAEPDIMKDSPVLVYHYAVDVMKKRWLDAEPLVMTRRALWAQYCRAFKI